MICFIMFYPLFNLCSHIFWGGVSYGIISYSRNIYIYKFITFVSSSRLAFAWILGARQPHCQAMSSFYCRPFDSHECDMSAKISHLLVHVFDMDLCWASALSFLLKIPSFSTILLEELPFIALHIQTPPDKMPFGSQNLPKTPNLSSIWIFGCLGLESRCTFEQLDPQHICLNISELWACLKNDLVMLQRLSEILP